MELYTILYQQPGSDEYSGDVALRGLYATWEEAARAEAAGEEAAGYRSEVTNVQEVRVSAAELRALLDRVDLSLLEALEAASRPSGGRSQVPREWQEV